jgi:hypothetical protein
MPVPAGKSAPQNEHFLGFGMTIFSCQFIL